MAKPVIVSAARTAIGTLAGALASQPATKLGAIAVKEAIGRAKIDPASIDEVILGNVLAAGLGLTPRA
jgi:acetyl-CoA C-acetyltransferase